MEKIKSVLNEIFIDGLAGMAAGLFATLIVGTILAQIGAFIPGKPGEYVAIISKIASSMTGAGIGVGVSLKFKESPLVVVSAAIAGMVGAFSSQILSGTLIAANTIVYSGPGEPLGAFIAAITAVKAGRIVSGKTGIDILITPIISIITGSFAGLLIGPYISAFMAFIGSLININVQAHPFIGGIIVSVAMGIILTLPISSAALGIILNLSGLAAGAATVGCCANMIGFAVAGFNDNGVDGLFAQGLGTSMLQIGNIVKKPIIWLPAIISSAILGPCSTMIFKMSNNATGAGMGSAGLVGQITTYQTMIEFSSPMVVLVKIVLLHFVLTGLIAYAVSGAMRKRGLLLKGDMKLDLVSKQNRQKNKKSE